MKKKHGNHESNNTVSRKKHLRDLLKRLKHRRHQNAHISMGGYRPNHNTLGQAEHNYL